MTQQEEQELIDAVNRNTAAVVRMEAALTDLLRETAAYIEAMRQTYNELVEARRPWWRR